jgi:nucleoside-diphosphate-sugar epimerase
MSLHLVVGNGPAGAATAELLAGQGHQVRVVSRSDQQPRPGIEHVKLDATDTPALSAAADGAAAVINCACPPYHRWPQEWPALASSVLAAAEASGAVLVTLGNLYAYGPVDGAFTEDLPLAAAGSKGRTRAAVWTQAWEAHQKGRVRMTEARPSDFFGPEVTSGGHLAGRVMPQLVQGKPIRVMGDPDVPHSWTYLPDVARTLARLAQEEQAWGQAWHVPTAPALSTRAMIGKLAAQAGVKTPTVRPVPAAVLRVGSVASPLLRELREVRYQFDRPFVVDSSAYSARFAQEPTPLDDQIQTTVAWWRQRVGLPMAG